MLIPVETIHEPLLSPGNDEFYFITVCEKVVRCTRRVVLWIVELRTSPQFLQRDAGRPNGAPLLTSCDDLWGSG